MNTRTLSHGNLKTRQLEALAFYLGAHGDDPAPVVNEIDARFVQDALEEKAEPLRKLHALEAKREQVRKERPEAETLWTRVRKELGETPPPYFYAIVMASCAVFALALDTLFLAPTMDILSIASRALQYLAAAGFAALVTIYFELIFFMFKKGKDTVVRRGYAIAAYGVGILCLIAWGLLRGYQLRFAAVLANNPLGEFLAAHPVISSVVFIFVTLAAPIIGANALHHGFEEYSRAHIWRRTKERFELLRSAEIKLARDVAAVAEFLDHFDKRKQAQCLEWRAIFAQFYERGQRNGATRETRWSVIRKSILGALLASPLAFFIPITVFPLHLGVPTIIGYALFVYLNHQRHHPSHERYLAQEHTHWAVIPDAKVPRAVSAPHQRLLTKGDEQ
jgi:MFS family permease